MVTNHKTLMKNGLVYLTSSILSQCINLFLIPLYTRNLSVAQFGEYNIVNAMQSLLSVFITLGIFSGMCRYFNEYEDKNLLKNITLTFSFLWGIFCIIISFIIAPILATIFFKNNSLGKSYVIYIFLNSVLACSLAVYSSYFSMQFKSVKASFINISVMLCNFLFSIYFILIKGMGIFGILKSQACSNVVILLIILFQDFKNIKFEIKIQPLKKMLKYGIGLTPGQVSSWILTLIDRCFLQKMISLASVGIYSMAYKIGMLINPAFINPFQSVFTPYKFSVYKEVDGKDKIRKIFKYYNFIGWFCILALSLSSRILIKILSTNEYLSAFGVVPLIAFSYYLWGLGAFYALGLHIANKMFLNSMIVTIAAIVNIVTNFFLIPILGMYGAALSTIISYIISNIIYYIEGKKHYDLKIDMFEPYKFTFIFLILYGIYIFSLNIVKSIFIQVVLIIFLCLLFIIMSVIFKLMIYKDLITILKQIKKKILKR